MIELEGLKFFDVPEIVKKLDVDTQTVRRWIRSKELAGRKIGRKYYVESEELRRFIDSGTSFDWREYAKNQTEKHMMNVDKIVNGNIFNLELLHHLEYFFYTFPSVFEELPENVKDYFHQNIDRFVLAKNQTGTDKE